MDSTPRIQRSYATSRRRESLLALTLSAFGLCLCRGAGAAGNVDQASVWGTQPGLLVGVGVLLVAVIVAAALIVKRLRVRRAEERALEEHFRDALTRFSDRGDPKIRADAAVELARIACCLYPGRRGRLTEQTYPLFPRGVSKLAASLCADDERDVRAAVLVSFQGLAEFAKGDDQELLRMQIGELAAANRECKRQVQSALGRYYRLREGETPDCDERLWPLLRHLPLCSHEAGTLACLRDLVSTDVCRDAAEALSDKAESEAQALDGVRGAVTNLKDCQSTLSFALRFLAAPRNLPSDPLELKGWIPAPEAPDLRECCLAGMDFEGCVLCGADLREADLHGAGLRSAKLAGAKLSGARLQWANLDEASLHGADLENARLQDANLSHAQLQGARLAGAEMHSAVLRRADLRDACFDSAQMQNADLIAAKLQGASFIRTNLEGAHLFKAVVEESEGDTRRIAYFTGANWQDASFTHPRSGRLDRKLVQWLETRFPRPAEDPETQPPA